MSNSKTRLWLVFTLFSLFLLAEHFVQFGMPIGLIIRTSLCWGVMVDDFKVPIFVKVMIDMFQI